MDKLKSVLSPGSKKDDEVLYGDADARRKSAAENSSQQQPEQLHGVESSSKKEHSILGQILNPGGDKYDDQRFGTTATTQEPVREPNKLYTDPDAPKDHSIARQILNPNNEKYDEQRFGETAATAGERKGSVPATEAPPVAGADVQLQTDPGKKDHSIIRQVLNPHGDKYDVQGYGNTAHAVGDADPQALRSDPVSNPDSSITRQILNPSHEKYDSVVHGSSQPTAVATATSAAAPSQGTTASPPHPQGHATPGSALSVKSGVEGPFARHADSPNADVGATEQTLPDRTAPTATTATALAGGGVAAAGGAGYHAATRENADDKITERPHPLSEKEGDATRGGYAGTDSTVMGPHPVGPVGGAHINPVGAPEEILTSGGSSYMVRDDVVGSGAAGAAGAAVSTQINSAPSDVQDATYTERAYPVGGGYHHTSGPHQTDIANVLDPHIPGEFPTEEGTDKHGLSNPPLGPVVASDDTTMTSDDTKSDKKTMVGKIASAVGLGGLLGGALSKERSEQDVEPAQSTSATTHTGGESYPIQTTTNTLHPATVVVQGTDGISTAETGDNSGEHHYVKDAGVAAGVAGAGAAGYGTYEATKDGDSADSTAATSGTVGQTSQQAAPVTTTTNTTAATAVSSESATTRDAQVEKDDYRHDRDAAIVGGAGAVGASAVTATRDEDTSLKIGEGETQHAATQAQQPEQGGHTVYILDKPTSLTPNPQEDTTKGDTSKTVQKSRDENSSERSGDKEKKHGLLHKILHPSSSRKEKEEETEVRKSTEQPKPPPPGSLDQPPVTSEEVDNRISTDEKGHNKLHKKSVEQPRP